MRCRLVMPDFHFKGWGLDLDLGVKVIVFPGEGLELQVLAVFEEHESLPRFVVYGFVGKGLLAPVYGLVFVDLDHYCLFLEFIGSVGLKLNQTVFFEF